MSAILNDLVKATTTITPTPRLESDETVINHKLPEPKMVPKKRKFDLFHTSSTTPSPTAISSTPANLTVNHNVNNIISSSIRSPSSVNSISSSLIDSQDEDNEAKLNRLKLGLDLNEWIGYHVLVRRADGQYTQGEVRKFTSSQVAVALTHDASDDLIYYDLMSITDCISDSSPTADQIQPELRIAYRCPDSSAQYKCSVYKSGRLVAQSNENKSKYLIKPLHSIDDKLVEISRASIRLLRPPWFEELDCLDLNQDSLNNNDNNFKLTSVESPRSTSVIVPQSHEDMFRNRSKQLILQHEQDQLQTTLINTLVQQQSTQQTIAVQHIFNQSQLKSLANQPTYNLNSLVNLSQAGSNGPLINNLTNTITNSSSVAAHHLGNLNNLNSLNSLNSLNQINQLQLNQLNKHNLLPPTLQIHRSTTDDEFSDEIDEDEEIKQFSSVPTTPTTPQSTLALFTPQHNLQSAPNTPLINYSTNAFSNNNSKTSTTSSSSFNHHMLADAGSPTTLSKFKKGICCFSVERFI